MLATDGDMNDGVDKLKYYSSLLLHEYTLLICFLKCNAFNNLQFLEFFFDVFASGEAVCGLPTGRICIPERR